MTTRRQTLIQEFYAKEVAVSSKGSDQLTFNYPVTEKNPEVSVISRSGSERHRSNNPKCIPSGVFERKLTFPNSSVGTSEKGIINNLPSAVLAGVASFLIQKDTQERTTVNMQGMYVCIVKYPILLLKSKYIVMTT